MELRLQVPNELGELLGPDPAIGALEAIVAELLFRGSISMGYAGDVLGMTSVDALNWYESLGHQYPEKSHDEINSDLQTMIDFERRRREGQ